RLRQHAQCEPSDRAPDDRGQPEVLGRGHARRRVWLRSRPRPLRAPSSPPPLSPTPSAPPMPRPPFLWDIEAAPPLAGTKLIAEAWDAAGLYQVGTFVGDSWREWNGRFRDDVRSFFRGEGGSVERFVDRMISSPALYAHKEREPEGSVNFVTCHDGFTLN